MAFSLIDETSGAVPITTLSKDRFSAWLEAAPESQRKWAQSTGFAAQTGRLALMPGQNGQLGRVLVGLGDEPDAAAAMWALAGLPDALPEGSYRLDPMPDGADPTRLALGWALATYAFTRYHAEAGERHGAGLARGRRSRPRRAAGARCFPRSRPRQHAGRRPRPGGIGASRGAGRRGRPAPATGSSSATTSSPRTIRPSTRSAGRARARRVSSTSFGAIRRHPKVTLVGKGVCFDTGGLDLKSAAGMRLMKKDMAGAAIVLGLAQAIMDAKLPVRLRVLLPCVENSVSGNAMRPLDVVRTRKGLTVEIGNTDAEGRLILCDALAEASTEKPALLVDMATLTGAARVALGPELAALFCNDDGLARGLLEAAAAEADPMWRMPLWRPYRKMIDSKVADLNNVSESPHAGAITAALYLQEFVEPGIPWAHLDVMAWNPQSRPGRPEGAEATALRALYAHIARRFA